MTTNAVAPPKGPEKMRRRSARTHFPDASSAVVAILPGRRCTRPQGPAVTKVTTQPSVAAEHMMENQTMKKAIFAVLTVLGISLATGALAPAANAYTYLFAPAQNAGGNS